MATFTTLIENAPDFVPDKGTQAAPNPDPIQAARDADAKALKPEDKWQNNVPPAVAAHAARANDLMEQVRKERDGTVVSSSSPDDAKVEPEAKASPPQAEKTAQDEKTVPDPKTQDQQIDWARKYQEDMARIAQENQQLRQTVGTIHQQFEDYRKQAEPPVQRQEEKFVTPEDEETFGSEFLSVVERKARELVAPLTREVSDLKARYAKTEQVAQSVQTNTMFSQLASRVPDWQQQNSDPAFLAWLEKTDPYTGQQRQRLLDNALSAGAADRVAAFFTGFQQETAAVTPKQEQAQVEPSSQRQKLEALASPGKMVAQAPAVPNAQRQAKQEPNIKASDITQFYNDVAAGAFRGRDQEKAAIEAMIFKAANSGRVSNSQH